MQNRSSLEFYDESRIEIRLLRVVNDLDKYVTA